MLVVEGIGESVSMYWWVLRRIGDDDDTFFFLRVAENLRGGVRF